MTEGMKLSTKTEAAPLLESESTGDNGGSSTTGRPLRKATGAH